MRAMDPRLVHASLVVAAGAVVMMSWQWGYRKAMAAYQRDTRQVATLKGHLAGVDPVILASGGTEAWFTQQQARLDAFKVKFPKQTPLPQLLNALVDTLKAGETKLVNVVQGNLEAVHKDDKPLLIEGVPCYQLSVTITAEGRYYAILEAIERLKSETLVSVGQVELRRKDAAGARLDATIQLRLYVFGTPAGNA